MIALNTKYKYLTKIYLCMELLFSFDWYAVRALGLMEFKYLKKENGESQELYSFVSLKNVLNTTETQIIMEYQNKSIRIHTFTIDKCCFLYTTQFNEITTYCFNNMCMGQFQTFEWSRWFILIWAFSALKQKKYRFWDSLNLT